MRGQAEIVVRGEIDDLTMVNRCACGLLAVEHAQAAIQTLPPQIVQRLVQVRERVLAHVAPFYGFLESRQVQDHVAALTKDLDCAKLRQRSRRARSTVVEPRRLVHDARE